VIATLVIAALLWAPGPEPRELVPGVSVAPGAVEFDARVAIDCHDPATPDVYLEMLITAPDSREHESLLVTRTGPSNIHAALLAAGLEPGDPVRAEDGQRRPARGDTIRVLVRTDGDGAWSPLIAWVIDDERERRVTDDPRWAGIVFAGSILDTRGYGADHTGTIASLTPFPTDVLAPAWTVSPEAATDPPEWIADNGRVPKRNAPVRVRIEALDASDDPPASEHPDGVDVDDE